EAELRRLAAIAESARLERQNRETSIQTLEANINALLATVQAKRTEEIEFTEAWEREELQEEQAHANAFRRRVAAAHADPDTYAPGVADSDDPVQQCSLSVIGEGLIQIRGPRKGVNIVHTMINQVDAPVGQVRVSLHTVQLNGEHGDRM